MSFEITFDFSSRLSQILMNPRLPESKREDYFRALRPLLDEWTDHVFLMTSGTTASNETESKWVILSRKAILTSAQAVNAWVQSTAHDVWLHVLPDFHVGGMGIWARSFLSGAKVVRMPQWDSEKFCQEIQDQHASLSSLVPTQIFDLVKNQRTCPPSMRAIFVGGGALDPALYLAARRLKWPLLLTYGMSEACSQIATSSLDALRSPQIPSLEVLPHIEIATTPDGHLKFKSEALLSVYVKIQTQSHSIRIEDPKVSGWFISQDRGEIQGRKLSFLGRSGDIVKVSGENVDLSKLRRKLNETLLEKYPEAFQRVELISVESHRLGNEIAAVYEDELHPERINRVVGQYNESVLPFERIRALYYLDALPKNHLGKFVYSKCLEMMRKPPSIEAAIC